MMQSALWGALRLWMNEVRPPVGKLWQTEPLLVPGFRRAGERGLGRLLARPLTRQPPAREASAELMAGGAI